MVPEWQMFLAKLSHHDIIEPGARRLYNVSLCVFLYTGEEKKDILHKNRLCKIREERTF